MRNFAARKQTNDNMMKTRNLILAVMMSAHMTALKAQEPVANYGSGLPRFDGYSTFVKTTLPTEKLSSEALTVEVQLAAETYPMMKVDVAEDQPTYATVCGNLADKSGFALQLSSQGDLRFVFGSAYANGYLFTIEGTRKLPRGVWAIVTAVLDKASNSAKLYLDGTEIGSAKMGRSDIVNGPADFYIGKDASDVKFGPFLLNTFCGFIKDISIYNAVKEVPIACDPLAPDFNYPAERYADNPWRPQFHGMPSGAWTNESHGLVYSDGRYHVFFQKNANGPYMSRLHWGHISSENLYDWTEEPIAIAPGETYDIKGCWSGCVYEDGGDTYLLYTAVDNARATIAQARATDKQLTNWAKQGIVINGRPAGLSDDFRDPYYFEANGQKYVIVGTSKNNIGACTLHKYENGSWTNDGSLFFQGGNQNQHGTFWEMPNVTPLPPLSPADSSPQAGEQKWLFTCTPQNTALGVRTLCWVGTIGSDGKFTPDDNGVQYLEMGGISKDGFGLLSPSIMQQDGKTLLLGIVPDKLPTEQNYEMGWAHNYSLPRELSLAADGTLIQKPYSGLSAMRSDDAQGQWTLANGPFVQSLSPVSGRQIELLGEFTAASGTCGFNFLKSGDKQASLTYDTDKGTLTLDLTALDRTANDNGSYNGVYSAALPKKAGAGEKLTLHVWLDGSIADIFVNDTWAFSVRLFPNNAAQIEAEAFATADIEANIQAWTLDAHQKGETGIKTVEGERWMVDGERWKVEGDCIYNLQGHQLKSAPQKAVYIQNGKKHVGR